MTSLRGLVDGDGLSELSFFILFKLWIMVIKYLQSNRWYFYLIIFLGQDSHQVLLRVTSVKNLSLIYT